MELHRIEGFVMHFVMQMVRAFFLIDLTNIECLLNRINAKKVPMISQIFKPWYVFRPRQLRQIVRRLMLTRVQHKIMRYCLGDASVPLTILGLALLKQGQKHEAIKHFQDALRIKPDNKMFRDKLNEVLKQK